MTKQFSQEQLLGFLVRTMSIVEGRNYSIREVNLCSKHRNILKNEVVVGHMTIIADDNYWQLIDHNFISYLNYTEQQYREKAKLPKRALFLKYSYQKGTAKHRYKNMPAKDNLLQIGSNIEEFPYLLEALTRLNNNANESGNYDNDTIKQALSEIKTRLNKQKTSSIKTKELVKKLNEVELYRHYISDSDQYFRTIWYE